MQDAEIRHLAALVAVADGQTLPAAARRLGCAQSTLRRQLKELERAAGRPLVEFGRGLHDSPGLTSAGLMLLEHAEAVIARVGAARADLEALRRGQSLRIGVCDGVATQVVRAVLHAQPSPSIVPSIAGSVAELVERVGRGDVDLSLLELPMPAGPIEFIRLVEEPYVLLVPARSELADRPAGPPAGPVPLVENTQSQHGARIRTALAEVGWRLETVRRAPSNAAAHALVSAGQGAALMPRSSVNVRDPDTVAVELGDPAPPHAIALAWHRYRRLPSSAQPFRQAALDACAALQRPLD